MADKEALLNLVLGMRSSCDAILALLEKEFEEQPCQHPKDKRTDLSTMKHKRWQCEDCGHVEEVK